MSDEVEFLREFRADVPAPTEDTRRRIHAYATRAATQHRWSLSNSRNVVLNRVGRSTSARPRSRALRWGVALVALGLSSGGAAIAFTTSASGGQSINDLVAQVQNSFGDSRLNSASVNGPTLTVNVATPDEPSAVTATFEAQMLAAAFHDSVTANGGTPIDSVQFVNASGDAIPGYGLTPVGSDSSTPKLASGACNSAASGVQSSSLVIQSALSLPYAGGACAFKFQTSDLSSFDAGMVVYKLKTAMGGADQRAFLVEVDDQAGVPQFVDSYTPNGGGVAYTKPGSKILFGP